MSLTDHVTDCCLLVTTISTQQMVLSADVISLENSTFHSFTKKSKEDLEIFIVTSL